MQYPIINFPFYFNNQILYTLSPHPLVFADNAYPFYCMDYEKIINYSIPTKNIYQNQSTQLPNSSESMKSTTPSLGEDIREKQLQSFTYNRKQNLMKIQQAQNHIHFIDPLKIENVEKIKNAAIIRGKDRFIKKNSESNVINQIFSFLWTPEKSLKFLVKIVGKDENIQVYYKIMRTLKVNFKSSLDRFYLKKLMKINQFQQNGLQKLMKKVGSLQQSELNYVCLAIKSLTHLYLKEISRFSMMTSKKMNKQLWRLHFAKCRQIDDFLYECSGE